MKMKYINIGDLWRAAEAHLGRDITQNEVSKQSGVTQATLSKMKRGTSKCDVEKLASVAVALHEIVEMPTPSVFMIAWID